MQISNRLPSPPIRAFRPGAPTTAWPEAPAVYHPDPGEPMHDDSITGDVRMLHDFPSDILNNRRNVQVYLPPGYSDPGNTQRYTVLYLQDGQNVFDRNTSAFGNEWKLDETAEKLIRDGLMEPIIMVGVYNTRDRFDEYTPIRDAKWGGGHADNYGDFLINELKPFVDSHYRTKPDASHTGIMGSSVGGDCSLYLSTKHPDVFGKAGVVSPSLWWANRGLTKSIASTVDFKGPERIWVDMGTAEGNADDNVGFAREMHDVLVQKGYVDGKNLFFDVVEGGEHTEASWAARSPQILQALFPPEESVTKP